MNAADFQNSPAGRLVPINRGQHAFVPNPLPPQLDLAGIAIELSQADRALGELNGIGRTLDDPMLLIRPLQYQEAITSSGMEGTYTTIDELLLVEIGERSETDGDAREVNNFRKALTEAIASLENLPLSLRTLRNAHATLLQGVAQNRGAAISPGEFKTFQNYIGRSAENPRFIPPPPKEAQDAMNDLERYLHRSDQMLPDLVDSALIHYQFETIHPFADGNGRVGRMLVPLHLHIRGALPQPVLYLSPTLERLKDEYIDRMFAVSKDGAWQDWIKFYLGAVTTAARHAVRICDHLLVLKRDFRMRLQQAGRSARLLAVIDHLFRRPVVSAPEVAALLGVTYPTARTNVNHLVAAGILKEVVGTSNPRLYRSPAIIDIIRQTQTADA